VNRLQRTEAIVLRRTDYGEADRILNLLTPTGKVSAIAKGVRKEKSKLAGGIELFAVSDLVIAQGKGRIGTITSARLEKFYGSILKGLDRLELGYEAIKQINRASDENFEPEWFDLLQLTFENLDDLEVDVRITAAWFRLQLAILLGVGLNLATDTKGARLVIDGRYDFDTIESAFEPSPNGTYTGDHIKLLRLLSGSNPRIVSKVGSIGGLLDPIVYVARATAHF
jgi:recombinational DNA repair protein (RecF pathway)